MQLRHSDSNLQYTRMFLSLIDNKRLRLNISPRIFYILYVRHIPDHDVEPSSAKSWDKF
jgi:hypothetical protein